MSRAKKTKRAKQYSLDNRYRHIAEMLNHAKKELSQRLSKTDSQVEGKKNALESPNLPERKV